MQNTDETVEPHLVKIRYIIPEGEDDGGEAEGLWSVSLGDQLYQLQNIPFYAEHLNAEDIVFCDEPLDAQPVIQKLLQKSGNRTLRVIFREETSAEEAVDLVIMPLNENRITHEKMRQRYYAFNVPSEADYMWARNLLKQKDDAGLLWLYEQELVEGDSL